MAANPHACDCVPHARSIRIYAGSNGESHPTAVTTLPSGEELDGEQLRGDHQSLSRLVCDLQIKLCLECGRVSLLNQFDLVRLRAEVDAAEAAIAASRLCARCRGPAVGDVQCDRCGSVCDACRALCSTASHWVTTPYRLQVAARPSSQVGLNRFADSDMMRAEAQHRHHAREGDTDACSIFALLCWHLRGTAHGV